MFAQGDEKLQKNLERLITGCDRSLQSLQSLRSLISQKITEAEKETVEKFIEELSGLIKKGKELKEKGEKLTEKDFNELEKKVIDCHDKIRKTGDEMAGIKTISIMNYRFEVPQSTTILTSIGLFIALAFLVKSALQKPSTTNIVENLEVIENSCSQGGGCSIM